MQLTYLIRFCYFIMCTAFTRRSNMLKEMTKFSFHHRAFYCYLAMSLWIFFLITAMYKYISVGEEVTAPVKKIVPNEYISKNVRKFRKIYMNSCNPPDNIVRGSEAAVDHDAWLLQGVLVVTRHGDRGPLTHLKGGDKLPCDTVRPSPLLKSYEEFVHNISGGAARGPWASSPGPFHNFPSLPLRATTVPTHCALGQLTSNGLLQMLRVGTILKDAYAEKLGLDSIDPSKKRDNGDVISYSTRYRRTYQSLLGTLWGLSARNMPRRASQARESHSVSFCFHDCACPAHNVLNKEIAGQAKIRLETHPSIKYLVTKLSNVILESQEKPDPEVVRDALLAYMCHEAPLPCADEAPAIKQDQNTKHTRKGRRKLHSRSLLQVDIDTLNMELDYINSQLDFNNEVGHKARDIIGNYDGRDKKSPLDFDAQMEREKLLYYQQKYGDGDAYDDVVIVKKNLDADFNFPNDARMDENFDEDYKEVTQEIPDDFCVKNEHILSLFAYLDWSYRQDLKNLHQRRRGLLHAYGIMHDIVKNMIRMISGNKPKMVAYSGHDKTLRPLILALGINDYQHYNIRYASRMIFEVYRKKDLRDEFKFTERKPEAIDFYFRVVYNGEDVTNRLSFCRPRHNVMMRVVDPIDDMKIYNTFLCPIENIVRFIHDDYFAAFNVTNFKDACAIYGQRDRKY